MWIRAMVFQPISICTEGLLDDEKNDAISEQFQATGTSLYLYNSTTKNTKDLTEMAFMYAKNEGDKFKTELEKEIIAFK